MSTTPGWTFKDSALQQHENLMRRRGEGAFTPLRKMLAGDAPVLAFPGVPGRITVTSTEIPPATAEAVIERAVNLILDEEA